MDDDNKTAFDIATDERVKKVLKMALQGNFVSGTNSPSNRYNTLSCHMLMYEMGRIHIRRDLPGCHGSVAPMLPGGPRD